MSRLVPQKISMLPYLHILIRVEDDGALHALGAFTSKEKQLAYQKDSGLESSQVRLDFYNGPFDEDIPVVYAGHRRWNMDLFQLGGYFKSEGEAWTWVTQEGYVSVLRIDTSYEEEKALQQNALERYAKLQRRWRLATYEELVAREGTEKARANIKLRFYEDALESFKPKYTSDISFYRSKQVKVFEFKASGEDFKRWAESRGMNVRRLVDQEIISRYKAYVPTPATKSSTPVTPGGVLTVEQFESWQNDISARIDRGLIAEGPDQEIAIYDSQAQKAYFEHLINF